MSGYYEKIESLTSRAGDGAAAHDAAAPGSVFAYYAYEISGAVVVSYSSSVDVIADAGLAASSENKRDADEYVPA
ncbi:MAG: hypothetical protein V3S12_02565, partial [Acidiferrobacterales bacterium]